MCFENCVAIATYSGDGACTNCFTSDLQLTQHTMNTGYIWASTIDRKSHALTQLHA